MPKEESSRSHGNPNAAAMSVTDVVFQLHGELVESFGQLDRLPVPDGKVQCKLYYAAHFLP